MRKFPWVLFAALLAAAVWRVGVLADRLPDLVAVTALIPRLLPPAMINIPNRDYWLAPERAQESLGFLADQGVWFACIFLVFLTAIDQFIVEANTAVPPALPTARFVTALVLLAGAIAIWAIRMFMRFRQPG
jgi:hypothetical protein